MPLNQSDDKMKKAISSLETNFANIRAGRANPKILDKITVDYYGTATPLNQVGNVSVPEARVILIQPWESNLIKEIEKSLLASDIGITPNSDGKVIRLTFPELTEDRRKQLTKEIKKNGEDSKVVVRNIRREGMDALKKMQKNSEITEDELKTYEDKLQKLTDKYVAEIDKVVASKSEEVLKV